MLVSWCFPCVFNSRALIFFTLQYYCSYFIISWVLKRVAFSTARISHTIHTRCIGTESGKWVRKFWTNQTNVRYIIRIHSEAIVLYGRRKDRGGEPYRTLLPLSLPSVLSYDGFRVHSNKKIINFFARRGPRAGSATPTYQYWNPSITRYLVLYTVPNLTL